MTLTLATLHGAQVAPAWTGQRFVSDGDTIRDECAPAWPLSLIAAQLQLSRWEHEAALAQDAGSATARCYARDALALARAITECRRVPAETARPGAYWCWALGNHRGARA